MNIPFFLPEMIEMQESYYCIVQFDLVFCAHHK